MATRQQGVSMQPKTKAVYLPLIDMTPSDPDTIMTALHKAKRLTKERGQKNAIFTSDQQLYKVAVEVQWAYPREFRRYQSSWRDAHIDELRWRSWHPDGSGGNLCWSNENAIW